jgi:hypothetical protein
MLAASCCMNAKMPERFLKMTPSDLLKFGGLFLAYFITAPVSIGIDLGNTLEAWVGFHLCQRSRLGFHLSLDRQEDLPPPGYFFST